MMSQALRAGRIATKDEVTIKRLLDEVGTMIKDIPLENTPPETGDSIYRKVREITGVVDPYKKLKAANIAEALSLLPDLKEIVKKSNNRLESAIRIAIAGNVIDFGVGKDFNIEEDVKKAMTQDFGIFDFNEFSESLEKAKNIMYIGDNCGESVFDTILMEELHIPITYVVRDIPVINDVTFQDAIDSKIGDFAKIISSGSSAPACIPNLCNKDFLEQFYAADMIISKGQGNYEGLSTIDRPIFFLLKAKCKVIADDLGVIENDLILKKR